MKNKSGNRLFLIFVALMVAALLASLAYERIIWGGFIPGTGPERIKFRERDYEPGTFLQHAKDVDYKLLAPRFYWNKGLYAKADDYRQIEIAHKYPTYMEIYVKHSDGVFHKFTLKGGP
jgi:hypothetical protein